MFAKPQADRLPLPAQWLTGLIAKQRLKASKQRPERLIALAGEMPTTDAPNKSLELHIRAAFLHILSYIALFHMSHT